MIAGDADKWIGDGIDKPCPEDQAGNHKKWHASLLGKPGRQEYSSGQFDDLKDEDRRTEREQSRQSDEAPGHGNTPKACDPVRRFNVSIMTTPRMGRASGIAHAVGSAIMGH